MSEIEAFYLPKSLDEPPRLLFWSIDEAMIMLTPAGMGIILEYTVIGMILGLISFLGWRKIKGNNQANLLMYGAYWMLPPFLLKMKFTPPSCYRMYLG